MRRPSSDPRARPRPGTSAAHASGSSPHGDHRHRALEAGRKAYDKDEYARAAEEWQRPMTSARTPRTSSHRSGTPAGVPVGTGARGLRAVLAEVPKAKNPRLVLKRIREAKRRSRPAPRRPRRPPSDPGPVPPPVVAEPEPDPDPRPRSPRRSRPPGRDLQLAGLITGGAAWRSRSPGRLWHQRRRGPRGSGGRVARRGDLGAGVRGPRCERTRNTALSAVGSRSGRRDCDGRDPVFLARAGTTVASR